MLGVGEASTSLIILRVWRSDAIELRIVPALVGLLSINFEADDPSRCTAVWTVLVIPVMAFPSMFLGYSSSFMRISMTVLIVMLLN